MNNTLSDKRVIIDLDKWKSSLPVDAKAYASAEPYPHIRDYKQKHFAFLTT